MSYFIYALCDPRDGNVRYVGLTKNPARRQHQHGCRSENRLGTPKGRWGRELLALDLRPILAVVEMVEGEQRAADREEHWINHFKSLGHAVLNAKRGGGISGTCHSRMVRVDESRSAASSLGHARRIAREKAKQPHSLR